MNKTPAQDHVLTVRGRWQNIDAAGIDLVCSCGQEATAATFRELTA